MIQVHFRSDDSEMECLDIMPEMGSASHILSDKQIINLNNLLPPRCIGAKWNLRYSSRKNGTSLGTLIRNCSTEGENRDRFIYIHSSRDLRPDMSRFKFIVVQSWTGPKERPV